MHQSHLKSTIVYPCFKQQYQASLLSDQVANWWMATLTVWSGVEQFVQSREGWLMLEWNTTLDSQLRSQTHFLDKLVLCFCFPAGQLFRTDFWVSHTGRVRFISILLYWPFSKYGVVYASDVIQLCSSCVFQVCLHLYVAFVLISGVPLSSSWKVLLHPDFLSSFNFLHFYKTACRCWGFLLGCPGPNNAKNIAHTWSLDKRHHKVVT